MKLVVGVVGEAQCGVAVATLEAAPVEELALGAQPLHHVHAAPAEVAHVTAAHAHWELLLPRDLQDRFKSHSSD